MKVFYFYLLLLVSHCSLYKAEVSNEDEECNISPKCASVILATGVLGGVSVAALTPTALCAAGFCPVGVAGNSFASWWQSTMPLVAKGSLFSSLQSIAMSSTAASTSTMGAGAVLGGIVGSTYLNDFCVFVDEVDSNSAMGITFATTHDAVITALQTKQRAIETCASYETCSAMSETVGNVASATATTVSSWWSSATSVASKAAQYGKLSWSIAGLELEVDKRKEEFGIHAFDLIRAMPHKGLKALFVEYDTKVKSVEEEIKERLAEDSQSYVRHLEKDVERLKKEFGIRAFELWDKQHFQKHELHRMYEECLEDVMLLNTQIEAKKAERDQLGNVF